MSFTNATGAIYNPVTPGTEQYRREDIAANMTPEQRRAMIQQYEDSHKEGSSGVTGPNMFSSAQKGINSLKGMFGKKSHTHPNVAGEGDAGPAAMEGDAGSLVDKKDGLATVRTAEA